MSGAISGLTGGSYGLMQQLIADSSATYAKLDQLTMQSSTGYVAGTYAGLDTATTGSAAGALSIAPQVAAINNTVSNLNTVAGQMGVQQSAITTISQIATTALSQFQSVSALTPQSMTTAASTARQALVQISSLINTKDGQTYLFGGQNSGSAPVPNASNITSSSFYTNIQSAVANLSINGANTTTSNVMSAAQTNSPFNAPIGSSTGLPQVAGAGGAMITIGIAATANAFVTASGGNTTGGYMGDIMTSLAAIANLSPSQIGGAGFAAFAANTIGTMTNALNSMALDAGVLGNNQALLATQATNLQQTSTALSTQLANFDQVNMTSTLANLSATQTQLQASYQLIAAMKTMSLTQYI
ncbi:MAG: flagellin [Acidiphilium sp.]|nr:flagellin [Acidiphilium sp.]MDD4936432.1 flagellin [Acidiphilium sp.]